MRNEKETAAKEKRNQMPVIYRQSIYSLIIHILKTLSSKNHPLTISDIINSLQTITAEQFDTNTIKRNIENMVEIFNSDPSDNYDEMRIAFINSYGGMIHRTETSAAKIDPNRKKAYKKYQYYFEPLLSLSDINMLCASITSNRYLNEAEKKYLTTRISTLSPYHAVPKRSSMYSRQKDVSINDDLYNVLTNPTELFERQNDSIRNAIGTKQKNARHKPLLDIIQIIDHAIRHKLKIKFRYGIYNFDETSFTLEHMKLIDRGKTYIVNPYVLCWNNGFYYMICTNPSQDAPYHFRVDRIISVEETNDKADNLPKTLKPFFKGKEFLTEKYTKTYPYMSIYEEPDRVDCTFDISANSLSILVDYFGRDIQIEKTDREAPDYNGKMWPVLRATITNIEYPCLKLFTIQHHQLLKVVKPQKLIDDLTQELTVSLNKYKK